MRAGPFSITHHHQARPTDYGLPFWRFTEGENYGFTVCSTVWEDLIFRIIDVLQRVLKTLWKMWITLRTHSYTHALWTPFSRPPATQSCGFSGVAGAAAGTVFGGDNRA